jgi:hypothetical protein
MKEALKKTFALQFMGPDSNSLIQIKTEVNKGRGRPHYLRHPAAALRRGRLRVTAPWKATKRRWSPTRRT